MFDEVGDAAALRRFVTRSARQPHANADRADLCHPLGENTKPVIENVSDDRQIRQGNARCGNARRDATAGRLECRKALSEKELPARMHTITCAQRLRQAASHSSSECSAIRSIKDKRSEEHTSE